jgi:hypothetical protein
VLRGRNTVGRAAASAMPTRAIISIRAEIGHCTEEKTTKLAAAPFAGTSHLLLRIRSKNLACHISPPRNKKLLIVSRNQTESFVPVNFIHC